MLPIDVRLTCEAAGEGLHLLAVEGTEGMNELSAWSVELLATAGEIALEDVLGAPATLSIVDEGEGFVRDIGLIVTEARHEGEERDGHRYTLALAPAEWLLTQRAGYRIFLKKTSQEIVTEVLADAGRSGPSVVWRLSGSYGLRLHCTQYAETEWELVERLLAEEGISYWFDVAGDTPTLVLGDAATSHDGIAPPTVLPFDDGGGLTRSRSFHSLEVIEEVAVDAVHVREYDVRHPDVYIEGKAGDAGNQYFEYPACVLDSKAAEARAKVRLEQLQRWKIHAVGETHCARLQPGRVLTIAGGADPTMNRELIVVRVTHRYTAGTRNVGATSPYVATAKMVPTERGAHRPDVPRPVKIESIEPAMTTGPGGEEIHVDDHGSVKIRFPWDRSGIADDTSSDWIRVMQMGMGGAMLLPRVGWEVPVAYVDGNPDKPIVLGRVYNAEGVVPYGLPAASATTTFQSATSPGGGSTNEIRMGDSAGGMEMFIHASRDQTVNVGGSATTTVGVDETHDVGLSYGIEIKGSQTHAVGASQTVNVGQDYTIKVDGGRVEAVGGLELNKVTANRTVVANGPYGELVGALYGLQCNQANTDVKGAYAQLVGASSAQAAGLGTGESVAGARGITIGGLRNIVAAKSYGDATTGAKVITAGACTVKAGGAVTTTSKTGSGTITVGGSANLTAGKPIVIKSADVTIDVSGSLNAGAMALTGGTLKVSKGTAKIDGTIKRQGGSEIE